MLRSEILSIAKPILFNTDMVRAILDGRKTVTRRVIKLKYDNTHFEIFDNKYGKQYIEKQNDVEGETFGKLSDGFTWRKILPCREIIPRYKVGDYLYIRETWQELAPWTDNGTLDWDKSKYYYAADGNPDVDMTDDDGFILEQFKWRPSIHMPKEAARIYLHVTGVRAERLQDINKQNNNDDILKEGYSFYRPSENPLHDFIYLWNSTISKKDLDKYDWHSNPWVWVYEFEKVEVDDG